MAAVGHSATYVALAADHLVAVVLGGKGLEGRLNDTTTKTEDQVEGRFLQAWCQPNFFLSNAPNSFVGFIISIEEHCPAHISGRKSYLLDVVVAESAAILELLSGEDQALLVWGNSLLVLDLGLDIVDGVARLHLKGNSLTSEGLDEAVRRDWSAAEWFRHGKSRFVSR